MTLHPMVLTEEIKELLIRKANDDLSLRCAEQICNYCLFNHTEICPYTAVQLMNKPPVDERVTHNAKKYITEHPSDFPPELITSILL